MHPLKPLAAAVFVALASTAHAATVTISGGGVEITTDPNASPAINFTSYVGAAISTPLITGDVTGSGELHLNGTVTFNGNIGTAGTPMGYVSTGSDYGAATSRLADGNVYTFNGDVHTSNFIINNGSNGLPYSATVVLGGDMSASNNFDWTAPNTGKISTLDLQGNVLTTNSGYFNTNSGGTLALVSTITAAGGQTGCTAGGNTAGCIRASYNGMMGMSQLPAALQVRMRVANGVTLSNGTQYTIVDFNSGQPVVPTLSSSITSLTSEFTFAQDITNTQDLVITVTGSVTTPLFRANAGPVGGNAAGELDVLSGTATDPGMIAAIDTLNAMGASEQAAALRRIAPDTGRAVRVAANQTVNGALDSVAVRLEGVRQQGFVVGLVDELNKGKLKVASSGDMAGLLDADDSKKRSVWMKGFGAHDNQDQHAGYAGYDSTTWGMTFGTDTLLDNDWVVGGALTYARTGVSMNDFRSGDNTDIDMYQATAYASRNFGPWYLDGMAAYARQQYGSSRNTTVSGVAHADFGGDQMAARVSAGWPFALNGNTTLTPVAGLEWNRLKQDSYTETGAGALSMTVQDASASRVRSMLGVSVSTRTELANGIKLMPSAHVNWRHDLQNDGLNSTASFTGGGAAFVTPGQDLASNTYNVGAALVFRKSRAFTFTVQLDGEVASGYRAVAGQAVGQWLF